MEIKEILDAVFSSPFYWIITFLIPAFILFFSIKYSWRRHPILISLSSSFCFAGSLLVSFYFLPLSWVYRHALEKAAHDPFYENYNPRVSELDQFLEVLQSFSKFTLFIWGLGMILLLISSIYQGRKKQPL